MELECQSFLHYCPLLMVVVVVCVLYLLVITYHDVRDKSWPIISATLAVTLLSQITNKHGGGGGLTSCCQPTRSAESHGQPRIVIDIYSVQPEVGAKV